MSLPSSGETKYQNLTPVPVHQPPSLSYYHLSHPPTGHLQQQQQQQQQQTPQPSQVPVSVSVSVPGHHPPPSVVHHPPPPGHPPPPSGHHPPSVLPHHHAVPPPVPPHLHTVPPSVPPSPHHAVPSPPLSSQQQQQQQHNTGHPHVTPHGIYHPGHAPWSHNMVYSTTPHPVPGSLMSQQQAQPPPQQLQLTPQSPLSASAQSPVPTALMSQQAQPPSQQLQLTPQSPLSAPAQSPVPTTLMSQQQAQLTSQQLQITPQSPLSSAQSPLGMSNGEKVTKKKRKRCGDCPGCLKKDNCGECGPCKSVRSHQICKMRKCDQLKTKKEKSRESNNVLHQMTNNRLNSLSQNRQNKASSGNSGPNNRSVVSGAGVQSINQPTYQTQQQQQPQQQQPQLQQPQLQPPPPPPPPPQQQQQQQQQQPQQQIQQQPQQQIQQQQQQQQQLQQQLQQQQQHQITKHRLNSLIQNRQSKSSINNGPNNRSVVSGVGGQQTTQQPAYQSQHQQQQQQQQPPPSQPPQPQPQQQQLQQLVQSQSQSQQQQPPPPQPSQQQQQHQHQQPPQQQSQQQNQVTATISFVTTNYVNPINHQGPSNNSYMDQGNGAGTVLPDRVQSTPPSTTNSDNTPPSYVQMTWTSSDAQQRNGYLAGDDCISDDLSSSAFGGLLMDLNSYESQSVQHYSNTVLPPMSTLLLNSWWDSDRNVMSKQNNPYGTDILPNNHHHHIMETDHRHQDLNCESLDCGDEEKGEREYSRSPSTLISLTTASLTH